MVNYESNLRTKIGEYAVIIGDSKKILSCFLAGSLDPLTIDCALSTYRYYIEITTLVKFYNSQFSDPAIKKLEVALEEHLDELQKGLVLLLKEVVEEHGLAL